MISAVQPTTTTPGETSSTGILHDPKRYQVQQERFDLICIGGSQAIVAAREAALLGGKIALAITGTESGDGSAQSSVMRRGMIVAGRAGADAARQEFQNQRGQQSRRNSEPATESLIEQLRDCGVDVRRGHAAFTSAKSVAVHGVDLSFERAILAVEPRPAPSRLSGAIRVADLVTLSELPRKVAIVGRSAAALETAQALARAGVLTHLVSSDKHLLLNEENAFDRLLKAQLTADGIHLHLGWAADAVDDIGRGKALSCSQAENRQKLLVDLVIHDEDHESPYARMALPAAGIKMRAGKLEINEQFRTSNSRVWALDAGLSASEINTDDSAIARCVRNALLSGGLEYDNTCQPWFIDTEPQIAGMGLEPQVGLNLPNLADRFDVCDQDKHGETSVQPMSAALTVFTDRKKGHILAAAVAGPNAAGTINQIAILIKHRIAPRTLLEIPHCPTVGQRLLSEAALQIVHRLRERRNEAA